MSNKRVYEVARDLDMKSKELIQAAKKIGIEFSSHMSSITEQEIAQIKKSLKTKTNRTDDQNLAKQTQNKQQSQHKEAKTDAKKQSHTNGKKQSESSHVSAKKAKQHKQHAGNTNSQQQADNNQHKQHGKKENKKNNRRNRKGQGTHGGVRGTGQSKKRHEAKRPKKNDAQPKVLEYTEGMSLADIAKEIGRTPADLVQKLFMMGVMVNQNQSLDKDTIEILADELGVEAHEKVVVDVADMSVYLNEERNEEAMVSRPPVVTIMGHVDHGKTTLLDTLRHASVAEGEAGGITQHIGAYQVEVNGKTVTFLDTPGHAAFTTMRSRGADVTDIVIIVVAADDGVKPQTVEAINHAKAADVPIIVAINKIDKPSANPDRVKQELMEYELIPEDWGGDTIFVEISALMGLNIDDLLEMLVLVSEVEELKADPTARPIGTVIEARLDRSRGPVSTILVQEGTLRVGDPVVVGTTHGRVRTMINDKSQSIKEAGPSQPVEITGLNDTPEPGDNLVAFEDEKTARQIGEERASRQLDESRKNKNVVSLENLFEQIQESELKAVDVVLKADVRGSVEALASSLNKIEVEGVRVNIIHTGVGAINESDVSLATASNALIIGFNVRPNALAAELATKEGVSIRTYNVIYEAIDEVENAMKGLLDPEYKEQVTGTLSVRETYKVSKVGTIAGCYVNQGVIKRGSNVRLVRDGIVVYDGELASLRRFDDDVKEVTNGFECGLMIENFNDIKVDDQIEAYEMVEIEK